MERSQDHEKSSSPQPNIPDSYLESFGLETLRFTALVHLACKMVNRQKGPHYPSADFIADITSDKSHNTEVTDKYAEIVAKGNTQLWLKISPEPIPQVILKPYNNLSIPTKRIWELN